MTVLLLRGDIHTQVAILNVNMMFAGDGGEGGSFLTLTLELWQNDVFVNLM